MAPYNDKIQGCFIRKRTELFIKNIFEVGNWDLF